MGTDDERGEISEDRQIKFSLSLRQLWLLVSGLVAGVAFVAIFVYRIESARLANETRWADQWRYNTDNTRAHAVIDSLVNDNRWRVRRLEKKAGIKTHRRDDEED